MSDKWEKFLHYVMEDDSELMELEHVDPEIILEEINNDPELRDVKAPDDLYDKVFAQIREYEEQKRLAFLTDEDKELIRLGKIHRKRLSRRKYVVLAAALITVFAVGTISMGSENALLNRIKQIVIGGEQTVSDKGSIEPIEYIDEADTYEKIEESYGFSPIKLEYLPKGIVFQEAIFYEDLQKTNLYYGDQEGADIVYVIRPHYRESSYATLVEDDFVQEYSKTINETKITVSEYIIEESKENRWVIMWEYKEVQYSIIVTNMNRDNVENIIDNLKLYE